MLDVLELIIAVIAMVIAMVLCIPFTVAGIKVMLSPSNGSFAWAWKLVLKGKKVRRKAWVVGVYIYVINDYRLCNQHNSFVSVGGLGGVPPTDWKPYIDDFSKNDWEEVKVIFE